MPRNASAWSRSAIPGNVASTTPLAVPTKLSSNLRRPVSSSTGPYCTTPLGSAVKLLIRTAPRTPCAPATTPTQTRFGLGEEAGSGADSRPSAACTADFFPCGRGGRVGLGRAAGIGRTLRLGAAGGGAGGFGGLLGALLRLRLRRGFLRPLVMRRLLDQPGIAEEAGHPLARLGADAQPMLDALFLQGHALGMAALQHRIVGAELLDEAAVARAARIGDDDRIERPLLGPAAGEPDFQRHRSVTSQENHKGRKPYGLSSRRKPGTHRSAVGKWIPAFAGTTQRVTAGSPAASAPRGRAASAPSDP